MGLVVCGGEMGVQNMTVLQGRYPYYSLFTNEKTKAHQGPKLVMME